MHNSLSVQCLLLLAALGPPGEGVFAPVSRSKPAGTCCINHSARPSTEGFELGFVHEDLAFPGPAELEMSSHEDLTNVQFLPPMTSTESWI